MGKHGKGNDGKDRRRNDHRGDADQNVQLSKKLSALLRHRAEVNGLKLQSDGYILLDKVLSLPNFQNYTVEDVTNVVNNNDKQRFSLLDSEQGLLIRANQGHTISAVLDEDLLTRVESLETAVHGTSYKSWSAIKIDGLSKMARNNVHMAKGLPQETGVISGYVF